MTTDGNNGCSKNSCACSSEQPVTDSSRRNFMKVGLMGSAIAALSSVSLVAMAASRQESGEDGDSIKVLTQDGKLVDVPKSAVSNDCGIPRKERLEMREGVPNRKWVMVIDLSRCESALKCQQACSKHHNITGGRQWLEILAMKDAEDSAPYWMPRTCFHCERPPCVAVCPVGATFKRSDGLVLIDDKRCIGCRFCMAACPYSARVFTWSHSKTDNKESSCHSSPEASLARRTGTVSKCDFCIDTIKGGDLQPCVKACPNGVFFFGDLYEDTVTNGPETYRFSELMREKAGYRYLEDLGTGPSVYYLPPVNRQFDFDIQDRLDMIEQDIDGAADNLGHH